ncbi:MAG: polyprenol monophosphomannose synthase [Myxococcales bacterium]|jgi:dolichol-phosphate mannosyltransferase|nr:polyprenol monophosphomannose synthase [Myxococcales bacterium]
MPQDALVIIPTYNELENLEPITSAVLDSLPRADVLIVDDNSPDGTGEKAAALAARNPRVHVLHREAKQGLGRAYLAGFDWALARPYRFIFEMDADFSHDPKRLPALIEAAEQGADLVLGSRYVQGGGTVNWGFSRQAISQCGSLYARTILGIPVRDLTGGFKCFRREVLEGIDLKTVQSVGYAFQVELTYRAIQRGFKVREIPILFEDRRVGQSKMSRKIFFEAATMVWKLRFAKK